MSTELIEIVQYSSMTLIHMPTFLQLLLNDANPYANLFPFSPYANPYANLFFFKNLGISLSWCKNLKTSLFSARVFPFWKFLMAHGTFALVGG
jgi:hypothetical protein